MQSHWETESQVTWIAFAVDESHVSWPGICEATTMAVIPFQFHRAHWGIICSSWPKNFSHPFAKFQHVESGFSGSLGWYQIMCERIWHMLLLTWVQEGAKVDLNQRISDFSEILVLKIWKYPTLRCNITKCLDLPGLKFLVVLRGTSMNVWI